MKYKAGYKYQLHETLIIETGIFPAKTVQTGLGLIKLTSDGILTIKAGYAWDGPSGPTIDTKNFMRGSLVHDALYQLMRCELISFNHREQADRFLQLLCIEDGMWCIRAWWVYQGLRIGGGSAADPINRKKIRIAP